MVVEMEEWETCTESSLQSHSESQDNSFRRPFFPSRCTGLWVKGRNEPALVTPERYEVMVALTQSGRGVSADAIGMQITQKEDLSHFAEGSLACHQDTQVVWTLELPMYHLLGEVIRGEG